MNQRSRVLVAGTATIAMFLLVQVGALSLVGPFESAGYQSVKNPSDPLNSIYYVGVLLVFTALMLLVIKLDVQWILRAFMVLTSGLISLYVFSIFVPDLVSVQVGGAPVNLLAWVAAGLVALALYVYPEWWVIDGTGIIMGAGAAGLFGISFGILPAIVLLSVLAVYDAISVYGTEHMLTLAEGVMELRVPVLLIVPLTLPYSFLDDASGTDESADAEEAIETDDTGVTTDSGVTTDAGETAETADGGEPASEREVDRGALDREAFFIGLGDAVMPTVMVASAAFFSPATAFTLLGLRLNLPALTAMVGTLLGLVVLLWMVMKGRAHAGLPLLNGGAIGGYLVGALLSGITLVEALGLGGFHF